MYRSDGSSERNRWLRAISGAFLKMNCALQKSDRRLQSGRNVHGAARSAMALENTQKLDGATCDFPRS